MCKASAPLPRVEGWDGPEGCLGLAEGGGYHGGVGGRGTGPYIYIYIYILFNLLGSMSEDSTVPQCIHSLMRIDCVVHPQFDAYRLYRQTRSTSTVSTLRTSQSCNCNCGKPRFPGDWRAMESSSRQATKLYAG